MHTSNVDAIPRVYFLDLEVDSVPSEQGDPLQSITQICLYDPLREKGKRVFEAYVKPPKQFRKTFIDQSFGQPLQQVKKYKFQTIWPELKKWVNEGLDGNRVAVIIGHNIYQHDWPILRNECSRIKEALPRAWKPFCTFYLARAMGIPQGELSITKLCQRYEITNIGQHRAKNDVKMLVKIFGKMIGNADLGRVAKAMTLPSQQHPVRQVASIIRESMDAVLVFFDFESTGLFPKEGENGVNPRATELAAYIPSKNASFSSLIDPGFDQGIVLSEVVIRLTGITQEMIQNEASAYLQKTGKKLDFQAVWLDFEQWMDREIGDTVNKIAVLAGHNIWGFDLKLYKAESERFGMKPKFWKSMDTYALSKHLYRGMKPQYTGFHKLQEIRKRMGIDENNAHRALGDVLVNYEVFKRFTDGVDEKKLSSALLSGHPILSTGQLVREEGGTFNPSQYMVVPLGSVIPAAPIAGNIQPLPTPPPVIPAIRSASPPLPTPPPAIAVFSPSTPPTPAPQPLSFTAIDIANPPPGMSSPFAPPVVTFSQNGNRLEWTLTVNYHGEKRSQESVVPQAETTPGKTNKKVKTAKRVPAKPIAHRNPTAVIPRPEQPAKLQKVGEYVPAIPKSNLQLYLKKGAEAPLTEFGRVNKVRKTDERAPALPKSGPVLPVDNTIDLTSISEEDSAPKNPKKRFILEFSDSST